MPLDPFDAWLRNKLLDLERQAGDRRHRPAGRINQGSPMFLGTVVDGGHIPTALGHVFLLEPTRLTGAPAEGAAGTIAAAASRVPVFVFGTRVPAAGDMLECFYTQGFWVAQGGRGVAPATCTTEFQLIRFNSCAAIGATVTFTQRDTGALVWGTTTTAPFGFAVFPDGIPGKIYDIHWDYFGASGDSAVVACGTVTVNIFTPPDSGLPINCVDALPTLFVTDDWGTREVYPNGSCTDRSPPTALNWFTALVPQGSCLAPEWNLSFSSRLAFPTDDCSGTTIGTDDTVFSANCTAILTHSGIYPAFPGSHPLAGTAYNIHA